MGPRQKERKVMKTYATKSKDLNLKKHVIDAQGEILGRLASKIAKLLIGKGKVNYSQYLNSGDIITVINASKIKFSGNKLEKKKYYSHSGFPGGFKEETLGNLLERNPSEVIKRAVWGMLPKNKLRKIRMRNLKILAGEEDKR